MHLHRSTVALTCHEVTKHGRSTSVTTTFYWCMALCS